MSKQLIFVSGLPRACSTLLQNILAQNPDVHATGTSGLHEIGYIARDVFNTDEAKATGGVEMEKLYYNYVKAGCENAYNGITDRPIVADKCRSWIAYLDQVFAIWPDAKVLVPVRDIRGVLTSFEKIRQKHPAPFGAEKAVQAHNFSTIDKRVNAWLASPPIGIAIERLHEAAKKYRDKIHFVHAEDLTSSPEITMQEVWKYLEMDFDGHDFKNVEQYTNEIDVGWPYGDHNIRPEVKPLNPEWHEYLGRELSEQVRAKFDWVNNL
jgi:sulfotransferase